METDEFFHNFYRFIQCSEINIKYCYKRFYLKKKDISRKNQSTKKRNNVCTLVCLIWICYKNFRSQKHIEIINSIVLQIYNVLCYMNFFLWTIFNKTSSFMYCDCNYLTFHSGCIFILN